jgi:hypothetical protein
VLSAGLSFFSDQVSGTCLTQTTMFMGACRFSRVRGAQGT